MVYGYCRVSTSTQKLERQERAILRKYPAAIIYSEHGSGKDFNRRDEWSALYSKVKPGDLIVFDSASRMSRNAAEGFAIYKELCNKGIELEFLNEPNINTVVIKERIVKKLPYFGNDMLDPLVDALNIVMEVHVESGIKDAFERAEIERLDIVSRTKAGLAVARDKGNIGGRKAMGTEGYKKPAYKIEKKTKELILKHCKDFGGAYADKDIIQLAGCAKSSYYKYKNELLIEAGRPPKVKTRKTV